jgi:hypothetical protein
MLVAQNWCLSKYTQVKLYIMRKFIVMALVASAAAIYQPAKAQVSLSVNIGTQPRYGYYTDYYPAPIVHRTYYAPATRYVYVDRSNYRHKKYYRPTQTYRSYYIRPSVRYYDVKQGNYKHYNHFAKHGRGHGKGRH